MTKEQWEGKVVVSQKRGGTCSCKGLTSKCRRFVYTFQADVLLYKVQSFVVVVSFGFDF